MGTLLKESLEVILSDVSPELVNEDANRTLLSTAEQIPDILQGGIECRLEGNHSQVDLQLCVSRNTESMRALHGFLQSLTPELAEHQAWSNLKSFVETWNDPTSEFNKCFAEIWLEFDCEEGNSEVLIPSIFLGMDQSIGNLQSVLYEALMVLSDGTLSSDVQGQITTFYESCTGETFISHIGLMLGRNTDLIRINVKRLNGESLTPFLQEVGCSSSLEAPRKSLIKVQSFTDRTTVCFDVGKAISHSLGFELIQIPKSQDIAIWENCLAGWQISKSKTKAIVSWEKMLGQSDAPTLWPRRTIAETLYPDANHKNIFRRKISHLKTKYMNDDLSAMKAYLWFEHQRCFDTDGPESN